VAIIRAAAAMLRFMAFVLLARSTSGPRRRRSKSDRADGRQSLKTGLETRADSGRELTEPGPK
jgi:hypothetical protein